MRRLLSSILVAATLGSMPSAAQEPAQESIDLAMIGRIKQEGLQRSHAQEMYLTLTDRIGARLTGSPAHVQSARWAQGRFAEFGLANARLEPFAFPRGWSLEKISVEMTAPRYMPLIAYADAWTPSLGRAVSGRIVYIGDKSAAEVEAMATQLRGAIVLTHLPQAQFIDSDRPQPGLSDQAVRTGNPASPGARSTTPANQLQPILQRAGAAVTLKPSPYRDGTVGVLGSQNTPATAIPSIAVAAEQYNMLARLAASGQAPELRVELTTRFHQDDPNSYNVIAEIPGTDPALRDEVVLIGAHLDSWHTASGATDNADGAATAMEAMRILAALKVQPRRTIRVALWSGEEQGLLGARDYIARHLPDQAARDKLAVYLNDDPGSGKTLGFYMEGNSAAKTIFDAWLEPFKELGATRNIIEGIGSTDHVPFNQAGMPGFNVIKDFDAYDARTRHTNADFPERMSEDELKQSAIILASFAWNAAQRNERIPRAMTKPAVAGAPILFDALNAVSQTTAPSVVEVASIKEMSRRDFRDSGLSGCPMSSPIISGNRISITGVTVCTLIRTAYSLEEYEIAGAPNWTTKNGDLLAYDIQALAEGSEILSLERGRQLLQVLLAQRFQLKFHKEVRDLDVLALLVDQDGVKLTESRPPLCSGMGDNVGSRFRTSPSTRAFATCRKAPLVALARSLTLYLQDPVVDRTGLNGEFTWELSWTDRSELASDLKQRLGLRMVLRKEPLEVTVIDRIEKATAN